MSAAALDALTRIARDTSLRYAMHMITTSALVVRQRKADVVDVEDVKRVYGMFCDVKRSTQFLLESNAAFMFNELEGVGAPTMAVE